VIVIDTLLAPLRAITSIERELRGLREDVQALQAGVGRIGDATANLEAKVDELAVNVDALGTLAGRIGRIGIRRREPEHP
jgi:hypothetical protein